jgi:hypothetical protein
LVYHSVMADVFADGRSIEEQRHEHLQ